MLIFMSPYYMVIICPSYVDFNESLLYGFYLSYISYFHQSLLYGFYLSYFFDFHETLLYGFYLSFLCIFSWVLTICF